MLKIEFDFAAYIAAFKNIGKGRRKARYLIHPILTPVPYRHSGRICL